MDSTHRTPGAILADRFVLERVLGSGAFGEVWLAHDAKAFRRRVAVKFLRQEHLHNPEIVARFRREGEATAALMHPNVVALIEFGAQDDAPYLVSEFVEGRSLRDILDERMFKQRTPTIEEALGVFRQICAGIRAAHVKGIIHRDLKPDNVLIQGADLGANAHAKVVDFGIARILHPIAGSANVNTSTNAGQVIGSPQYMAPEQVLGDVRSVGVTSDLFALAALLFELLTLQFAFPGSTYFEVIQNILENARPQPSRFRPELSPDADAFFAKAFALHPNDRFASVDELLSEAERVLAERPTVPGGSPSAPDPIQSDGTSDQTHMILAGKLVQTATSAPVLAPPSSDESTKITGVPGDASMTQKNRRSRVAEDAAIPAAPSEGWGLGDDRSPVSTVPGQAASRGGGGGMLGLVLLGIVLVGVGVVAAVPALRARVLGAVAGPAPAPDAGPPAAIAAPDAGIEPPRWVHLATPVQPFKLGRLSLREGHVGFTPGSNIVFAGPAFRMMDREVTFAEFEAWAKEHNLSLPVWPAWVPVQSEARARWAVVGVPWEDARAYCVAQNGELPSEMQWEFAARGNARRGQVWGSGPAPGSVAAFKGAAATVQPVGTNPADLTPEGLHDLAGNAQEWTSSRYATDDGHEPGPQNTSRTIRGLPLREPSLPEWPESGLYRTSGCVGAQCTDAERAALETVGFRCVRASNGLP